jgi:hypothetical protein
MVLKPNSEARMMEEREWREKPRGAKIWGGA